MPKWEESQDGDYKSYYNPNGYYISEEDGEYHISDSDGNELDWYSDLEYAKREALGLFWETEVYDELDYKEDLYEDNEANSMRKKFEYALGKLGIEITHSTGGTFHGSEYVYLRLPNGEEKKIRFADHRQVYSADMSVEENWRNAFKFFVERVQKEDWTEENYPENIRFRINEDDATSFRSELRDYIDGKLDRRHVFKLGRTPEVMRLVGVDDLPIELAASVLKRKEAKHDLKLEDLMNLPYELANPIAITQSGTSPDAIVVITGLPTANGNPLVVAIHLNQKVRSIEINDIRSIHQRTKYGIQSLVNRGELLYINTKRKPKGLTLPFQIASGRRAVKRAYGHEVFTEADISQEEKESFPKLLAGNDIRELERQERGNNPLVWASIVLAKDVLNGRQITQARLEKLLPGYKLDGSKYEYVKDRAQKIAETCRAKYLNAKRDIDQSLQLAESDYYWNSEQMEKIYDSFRKDGEAYGEAKQKIIAYLRAQKDKKLKDVKGYEAEDFKYNLVDSILQAMETEPKPPARESAEGRMLSA